MYDPNEPTEAYDREGNDIMPELGVERWQTREKELIDPFE